MTLPRVTEILLATGLARPIPSEAAMGVLRGRALHKAIELHHAGTLDEATIHPEVQPGFDAYLRFVEERGHVAHYSELAIASEREGFQGHLDRVGSVGVSPVALLDWKYTKRLDLTTARYQLAAYRLLWQASGPLLYEPCDLVAVVQFTKTGTYTLHEIPPGALKEAEAVFRAALLVYQHQRVRVAG